MAHSRNEALRVMMTWRSVLGGGRMVPVWILPNGWLVTTDGKAYDWTAYFPLVTGEDVAGGIEFPDADTARVSLEYDGDLDTVEYRSSPIPTRRANAGASISHVDAEAGDIILEGSEEFTPAAGAGDIRLYYDGASWRWTKSVDPGRVGVLLTASIGKDKGGSIRLQNIRFPGNKYPGMQNDYHTEVYIPG